MNRFGNIIVQLERCCPFCGHEKLMTIIQNGVEILEICEACAKRWELIRPNPIVWSDEEFTGTSASSSAGFDRTAYAKFGKKMRERMNQIMKDSIRKAMRS